MLKDKYICAQNVFILVNLKFFAFHFLIILNIIFSAELIPPSLDSNWNILQDSPTLIAWIDYKQFQWCKSTLIIPASIELIQKILENKENYPNIFKRIKKTTEDPKGNVHIILDMPFPFAGRDYIVKYSQLEENNDIIYRFSSVSGFNAIPARTSCSFRWDKSFSGLALAAMWMITVSDPASIY